LALHPSIFTVADPDADDESDTNASDDEYLPLPPLKPYKRCASSPPIQFNARWWWMTNVPSHICEQDGMGGGGWQVHVLWQLG